MNSIEKETCGINRKKSKLWEDGSMIKAMEAMKMANWVLIEPQKSMYSMPRTTLKDRLAGRIKHDSKSGSKPYLMSSEEDELVSFLQDGPW